MAVYVKDPDAVLDYGFDWEEEGFLQTGETIADSDWTIPDGLDESSGTDFDNTLTTVWLSGGTDGEDYTVSNHITTSAGREDIRSHVIKVRSR